MSLDKEEQELLKAFNKGKLKSTKHLKSEIKESKQAARNYLKKDARINIRLSSIDLNKLKQIAAEEGLPYQTLIASVLHKYITRRVI